MGVFILFNYSVKMKYVYLGVFEKNIIFVFIFNFYNMHLIS